MSRPLTTDTRKISDKEMLLCASSQARNSVVRHNLRPRTSHTKPAGGPRSAPSATPWQGARGQANRQKAPILIMANLVLCFFRLFVVVVRLFRALLQAPSALRG